MGDGTNEPQRVYANVTAGRGGPWDLTLDLGYQFPSEDVENVQWAVRLVLGWPHAKALRELLDRQIEAYEEQVGKVAMPPRDVTDTSEALQQAGKEQAS
jgi:hypothetical protein